MSMFGIFRRTYIISALANVAPPPIPPRGNVVNRWGTSGDLFIEQAPGDGGSESFGKI